MNVEWTQHARDLLDEQLSIISNARCPEIVSLRRAAMDIRSSKDL